MKCLTPECKETKIKARGLCTKCYYRLLRTIQRSPSRDWGYYIAQGLAGRAVHKGASTEVRRKAQTERRRQRDQYERRQDELEKRMYERYLRQGYKAVPGDMSEAELRICADQLGIDYHDELNTPPQTTWATPPMEDFDDFQKRLNEARSTGLFDDAEEGESPNDS